MKVGEWLRSLGLSQYEEKFRDNKIDFDVLEDLTDRTSRSSKSRSATADDC
jgi:SAM domain (Sterile alpha motif)